MLPFHRQSGLTAVQRQKALSSYFTSKQILHFAFAQQNSRFKFVLLADQITVLGNKMSVWTSRFANFLFQIK